MTRKRIAILGCTGSVGQQALAIATEHPDRFDVVALQAHRSADKLIAQAEQFRPRAVCLTGSEAPPAEWPEKPPADASSHFGPDGLIEMLEAAEPELVLNAITGAAGLSTSEWTLRNGLTLALANKESLVIAGGYLTELARKNQAAILPVDSEHCAIHQCLQNNRRQDLRCVYLTGSGGPFRERPLDTFAKITPAEALRHPTWDMGPRITVGSATMMNKAFEIVEARWLFDLEPEQIKVVLHPQSIVHSMVEYRDGSILAQCGIPDMRVPILYCLAWPERLPFDFTPFDPAKWANLQFGTIDPTRYPAIELARDVLHMGGDSGAVLNAADEELTQLFLRNSLPFTAITEIVAEVVRNRTVRPITSLADALQADAEGRQSALAAATSRYPNPSTQPTTLE
ncbi:MAG: 1-deoxy-D-xylulose-5-phosphate reductoisomerase [Planctomycetota bacterium]|nr:1-deoxy-D-xylulose-5-phosphate reductoisomerase [Planctomycetota bacterium]